jgi:hypothetical protein
MKAFDYLPPHGSVALALVGDVSRETLGPETEPAERGVRVGLADHSCESAPIDREIRAALELTEDAVGAHRGKGDPLGSDGQRLLAGQCRDVHVGRSSQQVRRILFERVGPLRLVADDLHE